MGVEWIIGTGLTIMIAVAGAVWAVGRRIDEASGALNTRFGTLVQRVGDVQESMARIMAEHQKSDDAAFASIRELMRITDDEMRKQTGEAMIAIRTKINEVELWSRDNFIRRESFLSIMDEHREQMRSVQSDVKGFYDRLDTCFDKLEKKIEAGQASAKRSS